MNLKHFAGALALGTMMVMPLAASAQDAETAVIGVSIPAATHGWAGGMNFHAQATIDALEERYENLDFVLSTASDPGQQVSDIEDMMATATSTPSSSCRSNPSR